MRVAIQATGKSSYAGLRSCQERGCRCKYDAICLDEDGKDEAPSRASFSGEEVRLASIWIMHRHEDAQRILKPPNETDLIEVFTWKMGPVEMRRTVSQIP